MADERFSVPIRLVRAGRTQTAVARRLSVSVWSVTRAAYVHYGVLNERQLAELRAKYPHWKLRAAAFDVIG